MIFTSYPVLWDSVCDWQRLLHLLFFVTWQITPWPPQLGWRHWVYDCVGFYCHFNDIPVQELRDIQTYRYTAWNLESLWKKLGKKNTLDKVLDPSYISAYLAVLSEWWPIDHKKIVCGYLHINRGYKYKWLWDEVIAVSEVSIPVGGAFTSPLYKRFGLKYIE